MIISNHTVLKLVSLCVLMCGHAIKFYVVTYIHMCQQDQGPAAANVPHANVHILGWPQPAQIINNEQLSVRNGTTSTEITHVAVPSGPAVIAQQTTPAQFHAVNVVQSRGNHSMLQGAPGSSAQPQGGFWDTVMVSGRWHSV